MKAICFCTRRSFHGIHKKNYENQCDLRNAAKCSEFTIIKATLPSKTLRCQLRMHWRHWQPALGHWASELLWGLQGTPTKARRIWNGGLKWTELWNEMKWVCHSVPNMAMMLYDAIWCYMMLYDAIWCYMMLYDAIWCYMMLYDAILCYTVEGWSQSNFLECGQTACGKVAMTGSQQGHSNPSKHKGIAFILRIQSTIITNTREPTPRTADYTLLPALLCITNNHSATMVWFEKE